MNLYTGLSIGELAERTGVGVSTLRAWERRHGVPTPRRLPSGHRRYDDSDVERVLRIKAARHEGRSMPDALEVGAARASVVDLVHARSPGAKPVGMSFAGMLAVSRAIEDVAADSGDRPLLIGLFQRHAAWSQTRERWRSLAPATLAAIALASDVAPSKHGRLFTAPIAADVAMGAEWAVICDGPTTAACLVGSERPPTSAGRSFDAVWSTDPSLVRAAAALVLDRAAVRLDTYSRRRVAARLATIPELTTHSVASTTALTNRAFHYLDAKS